MTDDAGAPQRVATDQTWWRRNKMWLGLLAPLLALAIATTGFRFARVYLPWNYSKPQIARGSTLAFTQDWNYNSHLHFHRAVTITVKSVTTTDADGEWRAAPGATLYSIELELSAAPDVILDGCDVLLLGPDGATYGVEGGKVPSSGDASSYVTALQCVPADAPGPTVDFVTGDVKPSPTPRPASWTVVASVAVPSTVTPSQVRVQWKEPVYALLQVPR